MPSDRSRARRILILGAAGRDFHDFNVAYRNDPDTRVVAFTATQIPGIAGRRYPASLAGPHYPDGIPIADEARLEELCELHGVEQVVFAYSDVAHATVMHLASRALAMGADFLLLGPDRTMLRSRLPVFAVSAVRTGCGKSQTSRWLGEHLRRRGLRVAVIRHPMPYGDLAEQAVQRYGTLADLDKHHCTAEEREEYEPHIAAGNLIFAGVDYAAILAAAEREADAIIWDGGNNDFPFIRPDLHLAVADALRPEQVTTHHPGEAVVRMADIVILNKIDSAAPGDVDRLAERVRQVNPLATQVRAASPVRLDDPGLVAGKRVLVVEDGPTITHGDMRWGAGYVAARASNVAEIVDPRASATPEIQAVYEKYPHIGAVLPAMGYDEAQLEGLRRTIEGSAAEVVISGTPIDLTALIRIGKPIVRARYDLVDDGTLAALVDGFLGKELARRAAR
jgi:predicted GTPase